MSKKNPTPLQAVRAHCQFCCSGDAVFIRECNDWNCPLRPFRFGRAPRKGDDQQVESDAPTALKAIRKHCVEYCQAGEKKEVPACMGDKLVLGPCPLFPFRMGKNPNYSEESRKKVSERMRGRHQKPA